MIKKRVSEMKLYGIFGYPLKHTLSPVMQMAAFQKLNLPAYYLAFEIAKPKLKRLLAKKKSLILDGFNVTVPHKETVFKGVDKAVGDAKAIGVVNTKTTAVRIIPAQGKKVGDIVEFGGLLGSGPVMKVNSYGSSAFIKRGGRIPAPMHSLKN